jgi:hypothetical protein
MQLVSNGFNILKVNGLIHVHMFIIEKMWKKWLIHFNLNAGFQIVTRILINHGKYKIKLMQNGFNLLKIDGSTHVPCW